MKTTRKDVSRRSGVSISTVGMILSGHGSQYSEETREKVFKAAEEVNYKANFAARGLRLNRSFLIGVSIYRTNFGIISDMMRGVQDALDDTEYSFLIYTHASRVEELKFLHRAEQRQVDGLIINPGFNANGVADTKLAYLDVVGRNVPIVEILGHVVTEAPAINIDQFHGGQLATEHLLSIGHRKIALLTHDRYDAAKETGMGLYHDAWHHSRGYTDAMTKAGAEPIVITCPKPVNWDQSGFDSLDRVLADPSAPTAVVCLDAAQGEGLQRAAKSRGVAVPGELSVVGGLGDPPPHHWQESGLTRINISYSEIGKRAAQCLLSLIDKQSFEDVSIKPQLTVRGSTGPSARAR